MGEGVLFARDDVLRLDRAGRRQGQADSRAERRRSRRAGLSRRAQSRERRLDLAVVRHAAEGGRSRPRDLAEPRHGQARRRHDVAADHLRPGAEPHLRHDRAIRSRSWPSRTAKAPTCTPRRSSRSNADTGKMVWYFQSSPHDTHDWDATQTAVRLRRHDQRPAAQAAGAGLAQRPVLRARPHQRQGHRVDRVHQDQLDRSATTRRDSRFRIRRSGRRLPARW